MGIKTKIEWCDSSINPIMGCSGCALRKDHCYAATLCTRYAGRKGWPQSFDHPEFFPGRLEQALRWSDLTGKKRPDKPWLDGYPRVIFVNDLSDGFCPDVDPNQWLFLDQMAASPHIWLLLTKWPDRMADYLGEYIPGNVWPGTSITNQKDADERIPLLLQIPAAVHFVSLEPLLGEIQLGFMCRRCGKYYYYSELYYSEGDCLTEDCRGTDEDRVQADWYIAGGETGHGARPMDPQWARGIRDQCQAAGVLFFFKSWGEYRYQQVGANPLFGYDYGRDEAIYDFVRVGKKRAGRLLDGKEHNEMPRRQR